MSDQYPFLEIQGQRLVVAETPGAGWRIKEDGRVYEVHLVPAFDHTKKHPFNRMGTAEKENRFLGYTTLTAWLPIYESINWKFTIIDGTVVTIRSCDLHGLLYQSELYEQRLRTKKSVSPFMEADDHRLPPLDFSREPFSR